MDLKSPKIIGTDTDRILREHRLADSASEAPVLADFDLHALLDLGEDELPTLPPDLSELAIEELRRLCNRMFQEMNQDFPRFGAREDYGILFDELHYRSGQQP
ncbi:hypothetical protein [Arthrobacter sp. TB 23]|uniref:hypothetical protein n=1 Tax=Arthrobacter sp. TB 23 TaxID=494419 RepID=UPI0012EAA3EF|nr:hypothetical protein [Arthrobacter sp. TB 23]